MTKIHATGGLGNRMACIAMALALDCELYWNPALEVGILDAARKLLPEDFERLKLTGTAGGIINWQFPGYDNSDLGVTKFSNHEKLTATEQWSHHFGRSFYARNASYTPTNPRWERWGEDKKYDIGLQIRMLHPCIAAPDMQALAASIRSLRDAGKTVFLTSDVHIPELVGLCDTSFADMKADMDRDRDNTRLACEAVATLRNCGTIYRNSPYSTLANAPIFWHGVPAKRISELTELPAPVTRAPNAIVNRTDWPKDKLSKILCVLAGVLHHMRSAFNVKYAVAYGAGLGRIRDGSFLRHDYDLDVLIERPLSTVEVMILRDWLRAGSFIEGLTIEAADCAHLDHAHKLRIVMAEGVFVMDLYPYVKDHPTTEWLRAQHKAPMVEPKQFFSSLFVWKDQLSGASFDVSNFGASFDMSYYGVDALDKRPAAPIPTTRLLTSGCFDPLHAGHIELLTRICAGYPRTHLTVAIPSDALMVTYKGKYKVPAAERRQHLLALACVNEVVIVDSWADVGKLADQPAYDWLVETDEYRDTWQNFYSLKTNKLTFVPNSHLDIHSSSL